MSDNEIANLANKIIDSTVFISRLQLSKKLGVSREKLLRLHNEGLIFNYPKPCTRSMAGTLSRYKNPKFGQHLRLPGSPKF
jgi:hypothetical protein